MFDDISIWERTCHDIEVKRSISEYAEQEIIIPNGPYSGQYYSVDTQPFIRLYFDAIESGLYQRFAAVGTTQSGKTLSCSVIPTLYSLDELEEDVIYGAPTIEIAKDKWQKDFEPVIRRMKFAQYMPTKGTGARGGTPTGINFLNGASLRFMTGGGSDKTVAGYTARTVTVTEVDGMDNAKANSREADRISQLEVRGDAFGTDKRIYLECTASITQGRIWQEYLNGTHTVIEKLCPYCNHWVCPEREHLIGWKEAPNERALMESDIGYFVCPACEHPLTAKDRVDMVHACRGRVDNPGSLTYSIRWNGFDNLFHTVGEIALFEYKAYKRPANERIDAEKMQHQFRWAIPYDDDQEIDLSAIDDIESSEQELPRFVCPWKPDYLTAGVDVGKHYLSWAIVAHHGDQHHIVDYGRTDCPSVEFGESKGVTSGLCEFRDLSDNSEVKYLEAVVPLDVVCVDYGWLSDVVYSFVQGNKLWFSARGCGATGGYKDPRFYRTPNKRNAYIGLIGDHFDYRVVDSGRRVITHDVDYGKLAVVAGLQTPAGEPGAITIFAAEYENEHLTFWKHMKAEQLVPDKKGKMKWQRISKNNHWLDAMALAMLGARMGPHLKKKPKATTAREVNVKTKELNIRDANTSAHRGK